MAPCIRKKMLFSFLFTLTLTIQSYGQVNSLYLIHQLPQSIQMNPAVGYHCKSFIEIPVLSGIMINAGNNIFSYKDIIGYNAADNLNYINYENLSNLSGRNNRIFIGNEITLLGGGLEKQSRYFSAHIGLKTFITAGGPKDLFEATDGNWDLQNNSPNDLNLSNTFINASSFFSIGVTASTQYASNLRLGGSLKYLQGAFNGITQKSKLVLDTDENPIVLDVQSAFTQKNSFPMMIEYDGNGMVSGVSMENAFSNVPRDFVFNKNRGMGMDVGLIYDYSEKITLSASITDLGFIRWKSNINSFTEEGNFIFDGFDLNGYTGNTDDVDLIESLADSIQKSFAYNTNQSPYFGMVPARFYTAAKYSHNKKISAGATFRADMHNRNIYPSLTFSVMYSPIKSIHGIVSYSLMNRSYQNVGGGIVAGNNIVQFYVVTDVIPIVFAQDAASGIPVPYNSKALNLHFGLNLIFQCREDKNPYRSGSYGKLCPAYN